MANQISTRGGPGIPARPPYIKEGFSSMDMAYELGRIAREEGRPLKDCPCKALINADLWRFGWHDADVGALWDGPESASFGASRDSGLAKSCRTAPGAALQGGGAASRNVVTD